MVRFTKLTLATLLSSSLLSTSLFADAFSDAYRAFQKAVQDKDVEQSISLSKEAWRLGQEKFGVASENAVKLHHSYANMLALHGDVQDAVEHFNDVIARYDSLYEDRPQALLTAYIDVQSSINEILEPEKRKHQLTERITRYIILNIDETPFEDDFTKAFTYYSAATVIARAGMINVSRSTTRDFYNDNLRIATEMWGDEDLRVLESRLYFAYAEESMKHRESAIENYEFVANMFVTYLEFSHPYALNAHAKLVGLYEKAGKSEKATKHCQAIGKMKPWDENQEPEPLYRVDPAFPKSYLTQGKSGSAKLLFTIDKQGFVRNIEVIETQGGGQFGLEAKKAVKHWRYAPQFREGTAVDSENQLVVIDFKIT